ncbi:orotate phosphoribosyltransferase, partial [Lactiplantibacillus pentosus]
SDYSTLTEVAAEKGMIGQAETKKLQEWRKNPANEAWITA